MASRHPLSLPRVEILIAQNTRSIFESMELLKKIADGNAAARRSIERSQEQLKTCLQTLRAPVDGQDAV